MTTLFLIRHGTSKANLRHEIQGPNCRSVLSEIGIQEISSLVITNYEEWKMVNQIIASPSLRTKQSGVLIQKLLKTKVKLYLDSSIVEFNPGILGHLRHDIALKKYPKYYKTWIKRGDLDEIPGAEKGDYLQARALAFLSRYLYCKNNTREIIIAHAGFNRCLVNTILERRRNTPVEINHSYVHKLVNPWEKINIIRLNTSESNAVYKIKTIDQEYVLKIKKNYPQKSADLQSDVINYLVANSFPVSPILYCLSRNNGQQKIIQILRFLPGKNCFGKLTKQKTISLMNQIFKLHCLLKEYSVTNKNLNKALVTLDTKVIKAIETVSDLKLKLFGEKLLKLIKSKYSKQSKTIVYWDLHRGNILFDNNNINFIDFDCIILAPEIFQLSSLLAAGLMLESLNNFNLKKCLTMWPEQVNLDDLIFFMKVRLFLGGAFFSTLKNERNLKPQEEDIFSRYVDSIKLSENWDTNS